VAGYREFQTGEVLTAANVNQFLMEQATMTFADDAARTAALAGVLREGLLTYNLDTNRLEVYDGTAWVEPAPEPPAGIGSNVVQTISTAAFTSTSTSFVTLASLSVTITPTTNTSKILIIADVSLSAPNAAEAVTMRLSGGNATDYRGATGTDEQRGAKSARDRRSTGTGLTYPSGVDAQGRVAVYLDSPATTSPVTYVVQGRTTGGTFAVNRASDTFTDPSSASSITAIEVAP